VLAGSGALLGLVMRFAPLRALFRVTPATPAGWALGLGCGLLVLAPVEPAKVFRRRRVC
jgi:hypothetical protein